MSKTVTTNVRNDDAMGMIHLFEFDLYLLNGNFSETLRFTDHDVFVYDGSNEYTPLTITFDRLTEDLTTAAMAKEFRNNRAKIIRVLITPPAETIAGNTYEFGISENASGAYPRLEIAGLTKDSYVLFEGVIDTFSASTQTFTAQLTTKFTYWQAPYPSRTYSQSEFVTIVDAISDNIFWGRQKTV